MQKINIAIDGYSSCGKSTLAKALAKELNYVFIDTGAMYRAVTLFAMRSDFFANNELDTQSLINSLDEVEVTFEFNQTSQKSHVLLNGEDVEDQIRSMEVSNKVSSIASVPEVRKKLVALQQAMGEDKGVVMDGRDIGTVVFPNAELKLFMTASPEVRVERRLKELQVKNPDITREEVKENIESRDYQDTHRATDPLRQADDALVFDNSDLTPDQQLQKAMQLVQERM
tara:strand:- start:237 stop:920 length:684 start_codon:yes stop_codon:yes gene_type:complete